MAWNRTNLTLAAAVTAMLVAPSSADAFWASHGSYGSYGSGGSHGSYGSRGSHGSYGSGGSHGSYGSRGSRGSHGSYASSGSHGSYASSGSHGSGGGLFARMRARRAAASHGSNGSYGSSGSHGSYASSGSHGSHGSTVYYHSSASHGSAGSHSSAGSHGSAGGSVIYHNSYGSVSTTSSHIVSSTPVTSSTHVVAKPVVTGSGMLRVNVPTDAVVYVNGSKTTSTGSQRQYVSHGLKQGQSYTYNVRVEFERDGKQVSESKSVSLTAGDDQSLAFEVAPAAPQVAEDAAEDEETVTKLTVQVPADATVTLAGAATKQVGAEREFLTTKLAAGATWEDYTIRVEAKVDGKLVTQERTITLRGGESQALVFDFQPATLASVN